MTTEDSPQLARSDRNPLNAYYATKALSEQQARTAYRNMVAELRTGAERSGNLTFSDEFNAMMAQELKNLEAIIPGVN